MGLDEFFMPFLPNQTTRESNLILVANNELVLHRMKAYYALNADIKAIATEATIHTRTALAEHKSMEGTDIGVSHFPRSARWLCVIQQLVAAGAGTVLRIHPIKRETCLLMLAPVGTLAVPRALVHGGTG